MPVPDYCAPLVGYREWCLRDDVTLSPVNYFMSRPANKAWTQPLVPTVADGDLAVWGAYGFPNGPGLHAWKQLNQARPFCFGAVGEVWLWGTVVEHPEGYRASHGYPKRIITVQPYYWYRDAAIAARYGIPHITLAAWRREQFFRRLHGVFRACSYYCRRAARTTSAALFAAANRARALAGAGPDARA